MVLHCADYSEDPRNVLPIDGGEGACPVPVCATHKSRIDQDEPWLWVPWNRLKGAGSDMTQGCILMGEELAGFGLIVDADVRVSTSLVFSADLAEGRQTTTMTIDGRLFGANQQVSLELILQPEAMALIKEAMRFLRP